MRIDLHAHLAGIGTGGSGCRIFPRLERRPVVRLLRRLQGMDSRRAGDDADAAWAARLAETVRESGEIDRAVALGFDGVCDAAGRLDEARSQLVVPPTWVFEACRRHPELLPGPAVNPHRRDAPERLEECVEGGAVLLKWLPAVMGIDPAAPAIRPFLRRMADAGLPLLVHSGGSERTFAEIDGRLADLERLRPALEAGVVVVVAHAAVPVHLSRDRDQRPLLREMLRDFPHLHVDNSGMANPSRFAHLPRLADDAETAARTLYGSDWPVPAMPVLYARRLGPRRAIRLQRIGNPLDRDVRTKRALGFDDATLTRAAGILPNLERWPADRR